MNGIQLFLVVFVLHIGCRQAVTNFKPAFHESDSTTHNIPDGQEFTFGYLEVLENRDNPESKSIQLPVYIFKSRSESPKPDPIIYTVGGPGYTSMRASQYMNYYQYLDDRDLILFEQRGNRYAKPYLDCPEWVEANYVSNLPSLNEEAANRLLTDAAQKCRDRLVTNGVDLNGYNTLQTAADIADLVQVLGIEEYNLLTMSYSTKIAQVLMRDYPDGIRSVVMDSPLPLEVNYDEESVRHLLKSLDKLLSDCESDKDCNSAYPNLKESFHNYLIEKTKNPLLVEVENPETGKQENVYLKGKDLISIFTSVGTNGVASIPYEINKLLTNDLTSLKKELAYLFQKPGNNKVAIGARLCVWCSEEYPFNDQEVIKKETSNYPEFESLSPAVYEQSVCEAWGVSKMPAMENEPVKSDIPVLLISGEYDNETPVSWATAMQKNLTNSFQLIFKGWKHGPITNWSNTCAMQAANAFFNFPEIKPDLECMEDIKRPDFRTE
ncbi:MAG: alpha/beta hydrolase [Bacteroidota bacterium]